MLVSPTNYATRNQVRMYEAYYDAARTRRDNNNRDLVHTKYMVIDPRGANPLVIHGSANWTASALVLTSSNDENIQFLPHRGMAEAFVAQFAAMTDGMRPWSALHIAGGAARLDYWLPDASVHELVWTEDLLMPLAWTNRVLELPTGRGTNGLWLPRDADRRFFRIQPVP
jgi:phosphatidylserine/phosphatidylglycerophosphate/cardiolipin synthase-like enzyme